MLHIEPLDVGDNSHKVACAYHLFHAFLAVEIHLKIRESVISVAYFGALNLLECGIVGKGGIFVAVFAHEVDVLHHILHTIEFGGKFFYVSAIGVFDNPIADVVQTRGVAVDVTAAIANGFEVVCKVAPRVTTGWCE